VNVVLLLGSRSCLTRTCIGVLIRNKKQLKYVSFLLSYPTNSNIYKYHNIFVRRSWSDDTSEIRHADQSRQKGRVGGLQA
jgi:hypothetical protein